MPVRQEAEKALYAAIREIGVWTLSEGGHDATVRARRAVAEVHKGPESKVQTYLLLDSYAGLTLLA